MRSDRFAKRCSLHAVVGRRLERRLRYAESLSRNANAAAIKRRHCDFKP
jgi:hypothetical protein